MTTIIDPETHIARICAEATWADVVPLASGLGLAAPHGTDPDANVVGEVLAGGLNWYARSVGLAADAVTGIEIITADGALHHADATHHPDLFWALRGADAGRFGRVTAIELQLRPLPHVHAGTLTYDITLAHEVLHAWNQWTRYVPDSVTSMLRIHGDRVRVEVVIADPDPDTATTLLEPLRALGPELDSVGCKRPADVVHLHEDVSTTEPRAGRLVAMLTPRALDRLLETVAETQITSVDIRHLGAALRRPHKGMGVLGPIAPEFLVTAQGPAADLGELTAALRRYASPRALPGFTDGPADDAAIYGGAAVPRLREVVARYSPSARSGVRSRGSASSISLVKMRSER